MATMKPIKQRKIKILKRNPVAKALGELGYRTKTVQSKKIYKRSRKKPVKADDGQTEEA